MFSVLVIVFILLYWMQVLDGILTNNIYRNNKYNTIKALK